MRSGCETGKLEVSYGILTPEDASAAEKFGILPGRGMQRNDRFLVKPAWITATGETGILQARDFVLTSCAWRTTYDSPVPGSKNRSHLGPSPN